MSFEEAAAVYNGGLNALWCLRQAEVRKGQRILIYSASGAIGTAGVQLARSFEADVTAVCSTKHLELVRALGADRVIDYTQEDFTTNGETYDIIFDGVGKHSFRRFNGSFSRGGIYLATDGLHNLILALKNQAQEQPIHPSSLEVANPGIDTGLSSSKGARASRLSS